MLHIICPKFSHRLCERQVGAVSIDARPHRPDSRSIPQVLLKIAKYIKDIKITK